MYHRQQPFLPTVMLLLSLGISFSLCNYNKKAKCLEKGRTTVQQTDAKLAPNTHIIVILWP